MTALAGSGVAVTNPVANSAAAANPIGSFMVKSSIWDSSNMQARRAAGKGAKGHRTIHSYTTALYRLLATRRCLTAYARARGAEPGCQARARRARGAHAGGGARVLASRETRRLARRAGKVISARATIAQCRFVERAARPRHVNRLVALCAQADVWTDRVASIDPALHQRG